MIKIVKTNSKNTDFRDLVTHLNAYLKIVDGDNHEFYNQFNNIDVLHHTIIAYIEEQPLGCGAFKIYNKDSVEIKRMFTKPETRGKGVATKILQELENWSRELGYNSCILETGKDLIDAINFYKKNGYSIIPNYGQYKNITSSVCLKKSYA